MEQQPIVRSLVAEVLTTDCTVEAACVEHPHLLEAVKRELSEVRRLDAELESLLPAVPTGIDARADGETLTAAEFPRIEGYEVMDVLGRGGTGIVYKARHFKLNRLVAIKMLLSGTFASRSELKRFTREAESEAHLVHPHIVQVYDVGEVAGRPYLTMELVGGGTLAQKLAGIPLEVTNAAEMVATLGDAVAFAHRNGIVHRDLKPANVLITEEGQPKISDFGLAQQLNAETQLTFHGDRLGTPSYMPPEQALGQLDRIGPASDVYALGAILYESLTGRPPFRANSPAETERQVIAEEPVPPARLNSQVPRALETVCLMCLRKEPARRYASAAELSADLRRFLRHEPIMAKPIGPMGRLSHWVRRHRGLAASLSAVAVLLLMLVTGSLVAMLHFRDLGIKQRAIALESEERGTALRRSLYSAEMNLCGQAANSPSGITRVHDWLMPWKDSKPDFRGWEWFYLYGLCHRDLDTLSLTSNWLLSVAVSPDGKRIAISGKHPTIWVFDAKSRNLIHRIPILDRPVSELAWSPDGAHLAAAIWDGSVKMWDADTARELRMFRNQTAALYTVAWNEDGTLLAAAGAGASIWLWDTATGKLIQELKGHLEGVRGLAWHPSENRIASAGMDGEVRVWDPKDPSHPQILSDHSNWVNKVAWHPDGTRLVSVSNDQTCVIWNIRDGKAELTLTGHSQAVVDVCWSMDGSELATCGDDQTIRIWGAGDGKLRATLRGHTGVVTAVAWCDQDRQLISTSHDGTAKFWSAANREETPRFSVGGAVNDLAWSPNGLSLAESSGGDPVQLLNPSDRASRRVFGEELTSISVSWDATGKRLASSGFDSMVHIWDVETGTEIRTLSGKLEDTVSLAWSHHGPALAAAAEGGSVFVWNTESGELLKTFGDRKFHCFTAAWSPDDRRLVSGWANGTVQVHDAETGKQIWTARLHDYATHHVAWSFDGKSIASAGADGHIHICDAATGAKKQTLKGHTSVVAKVAWNPNGNRLASASSDGSVKVWDPVAGKSMFSFLDLSSPMTAVAWSPDGKTLAAGSDGGTVVIYDATTGFEAAGISKAAR